LGKAALAAGLLATEAGAHGPFGLAGSPPARDLQSRPPPGVPFGQAVRLGAASALELGPGVVGAVDRLDWPTPREVLAALRAREVDSPWLKFNFIPSFKANMIHPRLPGLVQPMDGRYSLRWKRPGGLPLYFRVSLGPGGQGLVLRVLGCALIGPVQGPGARAGVRFDLRWDHNQIVFDNPCLRFALAAGGQSAYVNVGLNDGRVTAGTTRMVYVHEQPAMLLIGHRTFRSGR
jgi:hypothetical protein